MHIQHYAMDVVACVCWYAAKINEEKDQKKKNVFRKHEH